MGNVTNTGKGFPSEAIGADRSQVLEGFQLRGCEPFAQDRQIFFLIQISFLVKTGFLQLHTSMPWPLSVICSSFRPPSLTTTSSAVDPASTEFSINSFKAWTGATMISPAAILFTTSGLSAFGEVRFDRWSRFGGAYLDPSRGRNIQRNIIRFPLRTRGWSLHRVNFHLYRDTSTL